VARFRLLRRAIAWGLVAALLLTNVLTLTWGAFNALLSGALGAVNVTTVATRQAAALAGYQARKTAVTRGMRRVVARGAARSASSVIPQSVPVVGATIVAAVTAWELYDYCRLAGDLARLDEAPLGDGVEPDRGGVASVCGLQIVSPDDLAALSRAVPDYVRALYPDLFATLGDPSETEPEPSP
jgi:hypothetical protein